MGLRDSYQEKVSEVEESVRTVTSRKSANRVKKLLDSFLPLALILLGFTIAFQFAGVSTQIQAVITYFNWAIVVFFGSRLLIGLRLAHSSRKFVSDHWFDFLLVVPALSILQELKFGSAAAELAAEEEATTGLALTQSTGLAAKMTRGLRLIKRSLKL